MDCPLCGPNPLPGSAGQIMGEIARRERDRANLLDNENRSLTERVASLEGELTIALDALHALTAPRTSPPELNRVDAPLQLPNPEPPN